MKMKGKDIIFIPINGTMSSIILTEEINTEI